MIHIAICDDEKFVLHVLLIIPQQVRGELLWLGFPFLCPVQ